MRWIVALLAGVFSLGALGCEDESKPKPDAADAGPQNPIADKHILNAVASAATTADPAADDNAPPPNGVFPEGAADRAQPPAAPPKVTLIQAGSAPSKWLPLMTFTGEQLFDVSIIRAEGQGGVAVKFTLAASLPTVNAKQAPKEGDKPAAGDAGVEEPTAVPITAAMPIQFVVHAVGVHEQLANVPAKELEPLMEKLRTLKGSRISAVLEPNGALTKETFEVTKDADPGMVDAVRAVVDMLGMFFSAYPTEPVGQDGFWMMADRASIAGIDLVRYRVSTVNTVAGDEMAMSVKLRLYAAGPKALPAKAPKEGIVAQFQGEGAATITRRKGQILPIQGNVKSPLAMQYAAAADAQMGQLFQLQNVVEWKPFAPPEDPKKKP